MVIGRDYDMSLLMLVTADKENREEIVNFIKNIPLTFYYLIQSSLSELEECHNCNIRLCDRDPKHLTGQLKSSDGLLYRYNINYNTGALEIASYDCNDRMVFLMTLLPYNEKNNVGCMGSQYIGDISYVDVFSYDEDKYNEVNYNLIKTPFGLVMQYKTNYGIFRNRTSKLKLSRMPDRVYFTDFGSSKMVEKLIKPRKRKKRINVNK